MQHVVELSGRRGAGGLWIGGKVKVQDEHDDQAVLVLHRDDVNGALETHAYGRNHGERRETGVLDLSVSSCGTHPIGGTRGYCKMYVGFYSGTRQFYNSKTNLINNLQINV